MASDGMSRYLKREDRVDSKVVKPGADIWTEVRRTRDSREVRRVE